MMPNLSSTNPKKQNIALNTESTPFEMAINSKHLNYPNKPQTKVKTGLIEAISNAVFSHAFGAILPAGTVEVHSVQHLMQPGNLEFSPLISVAVREEHLNNDLFSESAVSVTDTLVTPARFMNTQDYANLNPADKRLESFKIRQAFVELNHLFKSDGAFSQFITRSLEQLAKQFAFCNVHQIELGHVSPETITVNGLWADMSKAGANCCVDNSLSRISNWQNEGADACSIFIKWVCFYNSFNQTSIDTQSLIDFYNDTYDKYMNIYVIEIIGLNSHFNAYGSLPAETAFLVKLIKSVFNKNLQSQSNAVSSVRQSKVKYNLLLLEEVKAFFIDQSSIQVNPAKRHQRLINTVLKAEPNAFTDEAIKLNCAIKAFRRILFSHALHSQSLQHTICKKLQNASIKEITSLSEEYRELAAWLFNKLDSSIHTLLFINKQCRCYYVPVTQSFVFEDFDTRAKYSFTGLRDLKVYVDRQNKLNFRLPGIDGWHHFLLLLELLSESESSQLA